jgi:hypothetical protein
MMTKELAKVDLSLARCWKGHANAQVSLTAMANESQKKRKISSCHRRLETSTSIPLHQVEPETRNPFIN